MVTTNYYCPDGTLFPVEWPESGMESYSWTWDQLHNPTPLTPLSQDLLEPKSEGMARAGTQTGTRFGGVRFFIHGYGYRRPQPSSAEEDELLERLAVRDWEQRIDVLLELWITNYAPETESLRRSLATFASEDESLDDLIGRFDQVVAISGRLGELHTLAMGLSNTAMNRFEAWCKERLGDDDGERIAELAVGGMPNKSLESAQALWDLSREIGSTPEVAKLIKSGSPEDALAELDDVSGGGEFRDKLGAFLGQWGMRNESFSELAFPTWREDPSFVVTTLAAYIDAPEDRSPEVLHRHAVERRNEAVGEAKARLGSSDFEEFMVARKRASQRTVIVEDHNYYIDQRAFSSLRIPVLAIGERMRNAGVIEDAADVFYLYQDELGDAAAHPAMPWRDIVDERKAAREAWMDVAPPAVIGEGEARLNPGMNRILGPTAAVASGDDEVRGLPGSGGTVTGVARVVLSLKDAARLNAGEILVTYATTPVWTPMFAVAGGVVTDSGGPLAHCAVVAREYGIPAVVGTKAATAKIPDGATITVDGTDGVVTISPG